MSKIYNQILQTILKGMDGKTRDDFTTADHMVKFLDNMMMEFANWIQGNGYIMVYSKKLGISKYINGNEFNILINGSDHHYTELLNNHGKTTEELLEEFKVYYNNK